jgi:hypothetical protein
MECLNVLRVDADLLAPIVEQTDPIAEGTDFCYFSGHDDDS